jgi:hypothetical protein
MTYEELMKENEKQTTFIKELQLGLISRQAEIVRLNQKIRRALAALMLTE